jgi:putative FmdB family regulatory protein
MPIYEYNCSKCGIFEVSQHIIEAPLSKCPHCRGKVRKLISQTSFQLKGSGWYATGYGKGNGNGKGKVKKEEPRAAETSAVSESAKTETKPKETSSTAKTSSH